MRSHLFDIHPWKLVETGFHPDQMRLGESLTSLGNGYMGMRGNFEERYSGDTHRGTYVAGVWFPDKTRVGWWKNGYPPYFGKAINAISLIGINVTIDSVPVNLSLFPSHDFTRTLDMRTASLSRRFILEMPRGDVLIETERFLSIVNRHILCIRYKVTPNYRAVVSFTPYLETEVRNEDSNYDECFWERVTQGAYNKVVYVSSKTKKNPFNTPRFQLMAAMRASVDGKDIPDVSVGEGCASIKSDIVTAAGECVTLDKIVALVTSREYGFDTDALIDISIKNLNEAASKGYDVLFTENAHAWRERWDRIDVRIEGDDRAQQGIRFNLFQLLCTYDGSDSRLNFGPKGFTGEKYGGATYWDTEAYCLPMFLSIADTGVCRNLLFYRYDQLEAAYFNARQLGLKGALYPMVTFTGTECHNEWEITFEEIHRNAAIAHAIYEYVLYTDDLGYLRDYGIDVLVGIARFWASRVHYAKRKGVYMIHGVTGPNEYENNVNNNWYTNLMAQWCLNYCCEVARQHARERWADLEITEGELARFKHIADNMYLPEDKELGIFVQHDTYLDKDLCPASTIDPAERPLNQHWSWDRILRSCFIKQADVLQGLYFLEQQFDVETIRRNFQFYEPMTVHESSLSACIHAILAAKIGDHQKSQEMYARTARLDLDNINHDTEDGCHITSMAGGYLVITRGFAGMRIEKDRLAFAPFLPDGWTEYAFKVGYRDSTISIVVNAKACVFTLCAGAPVTLNIYGNTVTLSDAISVSLEENV